VTDVLITGGDPLTMRSEVLRRYVEPLLDPTLDHIKNIRIGTKSVSFWPHRFVRDDDADDLIRFFDEVQAKGKHLAVMAHMSHPREMDTKMAREAIRRIRSSGATIRSQSPVVRGVNDSAGVWRSLWTEQVKAGIVPYYMFMARDTGAQDYFKVPLVEALGIYQKAYRRVSGLGRTARGPVMSSTPGKILLDGIGRIRGEPVLVLKFLQARDPSWVGKPFFATHDPEAAWIDDLRPAFGDKEFFFEGPFRELKKRILSSRGASMDGTGSQIPRWRAKPLPMPFGE
jgi:hypothetical protein